MIDPEKLDDVPVVADFTVRLVDSEEGGKHVEFASETRGRLAGFPAWDHADRDLRHFIPSDVPFGTVDEPYDDRDEGWRIVIYEDAGWIYVAEADDVNATRFNTHFRVSRDTYFRAWAALIDEFNPITPLAEET